MLSSPGISNMLNDVMVKEGEVVFEDQKYFGNSICSFHLSETVLK